MRPEQQYFFKYSKVILMYCAYWKHSFLKFEQWIFFLLKIGKKSELKMLNIFFLKKKLHIFKVYSMLILYSFIFMYEVIATVMLTYILTVTIVF